MADEQSTNENRATSYEVIRRWRRYPVSLSLRARVPTESGQEFMLAHGHDVSQGGMALYIPVEMEPGQTVLLQLTFPGLQQCLTLSAIVKNRVGFKYGVEFVSPSPYEQEIIVTNLMELLAGSESSGA